MSMSADYVEETQGERDLFDLGKEQWGDYKTRFVPLENQFIQELSTLQAGREKTVGRAASATKHAFDETHRTLMDESHASGYDPSSGRFMMGLGDAAKAEAKTGSSARTAADQNVDDAYYAGQRALIGTGQGVRTEAAGLSAVSAGLAAHQANIDAQSEAYERNAMMGAAGTVIGTAGRVGLEKGWFGNEPVDTGGEV